MKLSLLIVAGGLFISGLSSPASCSALTISGSFQASAILEFESAPTLLDFGSSVAISKTRLLVTAPYAKSSWFFAVDSATEQWTYQSMVEYTQPLTDADAYLPCNGIAMDNDTAVMGVASAESYRGEVVVLSRSGSFWITQQVLSDPAGEAMDSFGCSVGLSGDTLVVGAPGANTSGSGYVYRRTGSSWSLQATLLPTGRAARDGVGTSVAISGNLVVLGAPNKDSNTGAAYVFVNGSSGWMQDAKLAADDSSAGEQFGADVTTNGSMVAIAAPKHALGVGEAYVFSRNGATWNIHSHLKSTVPIAVGYFGSAIDMSNSRLVVGEMGNSAAHFYQLIDNEWRLRAVVGEGSRTHFGGAVSIDGPNVVIGAYSDGTYGKAFVLQDDTIFAHGF